MRPVAVVAAGAISPLGLGERATNVGEVGDVPRCAVRDDAALGAPGSGPARTARVRDEDLVSGVDRAQALLQAAARELVAGLDAHVPGWRERRLALAVGTSAGGMPSLERALAASGESGAVDRELARAAFYDAPLAALAPMFAGARRTVSVLGACMASTFAIGLGCRWLEEGDLELVIAGGYDALSAFVAAGFEALGATTAKDPQPFRVARDGMALGEGAALLALMRASDAPRSLGLVLGFGTTSDATHTTAPDPRGNGLARAALAALADAGLSPSAIEVVSAHATATPLNDGAEAAALRSVFGSHAPSVVVHPLKASIGHTFGAAGALETLAALDGLGRGVLPGALGEGALEPGFEGRLLPENRGGQARFCLKLSSAFGGSNAALVLGASGLERMAPPPRPRRAVARLFEGALVTEPDHELMARRSRLDEVRRARLDRASALSVTAVAQALDALGELGAFDPSRTGVVVATAAASLEADELFDARRRGRAPAGVEPRRFPATSPNLPAGACSIAFDFRGPTLAVGGGPTSQREAVFVASDLVAAGDADVVVVVTCNDVGKVTRALCDAADYPVPEDGARVLVLGCEHLATRPE